MENQIPQDDEKNMLSGILTENNSKSNKKFQQGRWTKQEHERFLEALELYGKNWKKVEEHLATRSGAQIRSHAQKFFNRIEKKQQIHQGGQKENNASILPDSGEFSFENKESEKVIQNIQIPPPLDQQETNISNSQQPMTPSLQVIPNKKSVHQQQVTKIKQPIQSQQISQIKTPSELLTSQFSQNISLPPQNPFMNNEIISQSTPVNMLLETIYKMTSQIFDTQSMINLINYPPKQYKSPAQDIKENIQPASLFQICDIAKQQNQPNYSNNQNQKKTQGFSLVKDGHEQFQKVENLRRKLSLDQELTKKHRMI